MADNIYSIKDPSGEIYTVMISNDLFENHTCTCSYYKMNRDCTHIQSLLNNTNSFDTGENVVFFDIETQFSAEDIGGWGNIDKMRVAVAVTYSIKEDKYEYYMEEEVQKLINNLKKSTLVVGFNSKGFDYKVLQPYSPDFKLSNLPSLDMLEEVFKSLGYRISLNSIAEATLNEGKSADGLQSIEWFRRGEIQKVIDYCKQDVHVTREIYLFGKKNGYLKFYDKRSGKIKKVNVNW
jgi:DEAD/DEAH box helicase domain-containing protein